MRLTRRKLLLAGGAGAVLAAGGVYELVDQLTGAPSRPTAGGLPPEQHVLRDVRLVEDNGVEVVVPPLHHQLVTAKLAVGGAAERARRGPLGARTCAGGAGGPVRAPHRRARRHRRLGPPVLSLLRSEAGRPPHPPRPTRDEDGEQARPRPARLEALSERPARTRPRGQRRRSAPAQRPPRPHRGSLESALPGPRPLPGRRASARASRAADSTAAGVSRSRWRSRPRCPART